MVGAATSTTSGLPPIEVGFYILSIFAMITGLLGLAYKGITAWGNARGTWNDTLDAMKTLQSSVEAHYAKDDDRFAAEALARTTGLAEVHRRIDDLIGRKATP